MALDTSDASLDAFLSWFKTWGGSVHPAMGITTFPTMGHGGIALHDIKKETVLFALPRSLTLSTRTSTLPSRFGERAWRQFGLHKGWVGLILCMLWETATGKDGKWSCYLDSLPDSFQTPMFWSALDLQELEGTSMADKIGKAEAEMDYFEKLLPAVKSRPDLFPLSVVDTHYSLPRYHIMGSLILSRSFHVEKWSGNAGDDPDSNYSPVHGVRSNMDVEPEQIGVDSSEGYGDEDDEGSYSEVDDHDDPADVAMVPMADLLNARYHSENAKLCYEAEELQMISTRDIAAGEQIWNTYGDLPNSDLLRRYGHVDMIPIPGEVEGNPADVVEIRADIVVDVVRDHATGNASDFSERIEWWLEEGGDDEFTLGTSLALPGEMVSLIRLLSMPEPEWATAREKGKIPKPKVDPTILRAAYTILEKRLGCYKTSVQEDVKILSESEICVNKRMAVIVRFGEKRILMGALGSIATQLDREGDKIKRTSSNGDIDGHRRNKKTRV